MWTIPSACHSELCGEGLMHVKWKHEVSKWFGLHSFDGHQQAAAEFDTCACIYKFSSEWI